jgi:UDP-N-acetylmuramate--alanine ligase
MVRVYLRSTCTTDAGLKSALLQHADCSYVAKVADMPEAITTMLRDGDVVITMGAGSISTLPAILSGAQHA